MLLMTLKSNSYYITAIRPFRKHVVFVMPSSATRNRDSKTAQIILNLFTVRSCNLIKKQIGTDYVMIRFEICINSVHQFNDVSGRALE